MKDNRSQKTMKFRIDKEQSNTPHNILKGV